MGAIIPQVITNRSGAQVIDGSLKFVSGGDYHLVRTPSASNRRTFTWSSWHKRAELGDDVHTIFSAAPSGHASDPAISYLVFEDHNTLRFFNYWSSATRADIKTNALYRDVSAWYHVVLAVDTTIASPSSDRMKLYVNGEQITSFANETYPTQNLELYINANVEHKIGEESVRDRYEYAGYMSNVYFVDGQQLDPSYFGFTDPLTNIWRPKNYTGTYGTNGFYLPFDGSAPIGEDQSGRGNNWTPVRFGGSNTLDKATGGKPILRTVNSGNIASGGAKTFRKTYAVTVANDGGNKYFLDGVNYTSTTIPLLRGGTYKFDQSDSTNSGHPLRFATAADAAGSTEYTDGVTQSGTPGQAGAYTIIIVPHDAPNTLYYYCTNHSGMGGATSNSTDETKTDLYASSLVLALPLPGDITDVTHTINSTRTQLSFTDTGSTSTNDSNFYSASRDFDGSNDFLKASVPNSDALHLQASSWTVECWFNADVQPGGNDVYLGGVRVDTSSNANQCWNIRIYNNVIQAMWVSGGTQYRTDSPVTIKASKWTHVAYVRDGNEQRLYQDGALVATTSHTSTPNLNNSSFLEIGGRTGSGFFNGKIQDFRIYSGLAKYTNNFIPVSTNPDVLPDTPSGISYGSEFEKITDGSVQFDGSGDYLSIAASDDNDFGTTTDYTIEFWAYFSKNTSSSNQYVFDMGDNGTRVQLYQQDFYFYFTSSIFVSTSYTGIGEWVHLALCRSGGVGYGFKNGTLIGTISAAASAGSSSAWRLGEYGGGSHGLEGHISNFRILKGTALYTSDFTPPSAPLTNVTNTKLLCCQSTTSATAAAVTPGSITANGDAAATNFNPFTTDINAVRGQESGYATLNPLVVSGGTSLTLSDGNLNVTSSGIHQWTAGTIGVSSGKWYVEYKVVVNTNTHGIGIRANISNNTVSYSETTAYYWQFWDQQYYYAGSVTSYGSRPSANDIVAMAIDLDNGTIEWYVNNTSQGQKTGIPLGDTYQILWHASASQSGSFNFGQKPFKFPPPKGFKALSLANLPRPTEAAVRPDKYFNIVLYPGDSSNTTNRVVGFQPDLVWIKNRTDTGEGSSNHMLYDSLRGTNDHLMPDRPDAESSNVNGLQEYTADGFKPGSLTRTNSTSRNYVAWCWKAGTPYTPTVTGGFSSPSASINTDAGFGIYKVTGSNSQSSFTTGLNEQADFIMCKNLDNDYNWGVYHRSYSGAAPSAKLLHLNNTAVPSDKGTNIWIQTGTTIEVASYAETGSTGDYIYYVWHNVPGMQKFGSYVGNGNADGPFIYLGFRPAFVMVKRATGGSANWQIMDTARSTFNPADKWIEANEPAAEQTGNSFIKEDFLSNGFKPRGGASSQDNISGSVYVYMAWAEAPSMNLYGAQATAR